MSQTERKPTSQAAAGGDHTEQLLTDVRLRFGLKARAVKVLRVMLGNAGDDWLYRGSETDIAAAVREASGKPFSKVTASRGVDDLQNAGLVTGKHRRGRKKQFRVRIDVMRGEATLADAVEQTSLQRPKPRYRVHYTDAGTELRPVTALTSDVERGQNAPVSAVDDATDRTQPDKMSAVNDGPVSVRGQSLPPSVVPPSVSVSVHGSVAENFHGRRDRLPWQRERFTDADLVTLDRRMLATLFAESVRQGNLDNDQAVEFYAVAFHCATHPNIPTGQRAKYFTGRVRKHNFRGVVDAAWDWAKQVVRDPKFERAPKSADAQRVELENKFRDRRDANSPRDDPKPVNAEFAEAHEFASEILAKQELAAAGRGD